MQVLPSHQHRGTLGRFDQPCNDRIEGRIALLLRHRKARIPSSGNGTAIRSANTRTLSERGKVLKPPRPTSSFARCCCAVSSGCPPNTRFKCSMIG